jgi:hypothetical protein
MTRQRVFYRIGQLAALVLVISWFWWGLREMNYVDFSTTPFAQLGQTVPHATQGIIVYITAGDAHFDELLTRTGIVAAVITAVCLLLSGELSKILNPPNPPSQPEL